MISKIRTYTRGGDPSAVKESIEEAEIHCLGDPELFTELARGMPKRAQAVINGTPSVNFIFIPQSCSYQFIYVL